MAQTTSPSLEKLGWQFEQFAETCRHFGSLLYEALSLATAADPELLGLATEARHGPVPNLLFAAAHFLLLRGAEHPVSAFYPSLTTTPGRAEEAYPLFRAFCLERRAEIAAMLATHRVQTNEVRRCACLLPAFGMVAHRAAERPLALLEIGASAGLNLLWDRYGYDYGDGQKHGDPASPVRIRCRVQGNRRPPIPSLFPSVSYRMGVDIHPLDVRSTQDTDWLRALIWPEHTERADLLQRAVAVARQNPPSLVEGDAPETLPELLPEVPRDAALCLLHTFTLNQFSPAAREALETLLVGHAAGRDLFRVSMRGRGTDHAVLELASYRRGERTERVLGRCSMHGEWLEWLAADNH